jgi:hypothetical protein
LKKLVAIILALVFLTSCNNNSSVVPSKKLDPLSNQFVSEDDLFRLVLHIDKLNYRSDEKIDLHSTLEYLGSKKKITIWHGLPYINYYITDEKDFNTGGIALTILTSSTLNKGEVYTYPFSKTGGFSEDDPKADFWRTFYSEKDLYLPPGKYKLSVSCNFSFTEDVKESKYNNIVEIEITVQ